MITLHESNITSFPHDNGIGVLRDVIRAYTEEELNGLFEFYMEYDSEGVFVDELKEERIIKAKAQDKLGYQLFRIYSITKNHENDNLIVQAQHITYDLANNFVESLEARNLTKKQVMEKIGSSTAYPHPFNVTSSNTTTISSTSLYRTNPLQMVGGTEGSVLQIWGGQIERDNFNLILHDRRGSDDGVKVTYEKNITGLEATFDISGLVTRIFPFVYIEATDDEPERLITVSGKYIDSPHINDYEKIYIEPIDYSNDERINTDGTDAQIRRQLTNIASQYFTETGNDKIKVDMEVQFEHLWETEEYKDLAVLELVGMGDTVTIEHSRLKVNATAIVNYIRYDCIAEKNEEVRLGSVKARLTDSVNRVVDVAEKAEQAQQTANQAIRAANGKNTIYYGPDEPEGGIEGDLWFRVVDGEYTRTYRHDGIQWQLVLSVDVRDAVNEAQQAKDRADDAVNRANQATQTANTAIGQAQASFDLAQENATQIDSLGLQIGNVEDGLTTISGTVDGLQTTVSDVQGNVANLTVISNAMQARLSDAEGNINTLTLTSQSMQSTISSLQDEWDNLEIGGRNLLRNSNDFSDWSTFSGATYTTEVLNNGYTRVRTTGGTHVLKVFKLLNNYLPIEEFEGKTITISFDLINYTDKPIVLIGNAISFREKVLEGGFAGRVVLTGRVGNISRQLQFRVVNAEDNLDFGIRQMQLEKGTVATDWSPAPEDLATQSQITQLSDAINLRVEKGDVINQINLDTSGVLISGKKLILDGDTTVTGQFKVRSANIVSLDAGKVTVGDLVGHSLVGGSVIGGYIEQQSGNRRLEMYDGIIDSFYNGQLAMRFGQYSMEFYNRADDSLGRIIPVAQSSDPDKKGLGFIVDGDILNIGFEKSGLYRAILRTDFAGNVTTLTGPYNNLNNGSTLRLMANRRAVSEDRFSSVDQPSILLDQGDDTNDVTVYFGGFGRRSGANASFRWRSSETTYREVLSVHMHGIELRDRDLYTGRSPDGAPVFRANAIRRRTSTNDANVRINPDPDSDGLMYRTTSSRKHKVNIEEIPYDHALKVLNLTPSTWYDKNDCETYAEYLSCGDRSLLADVEPIRRIPGLIAEDVERAGLTEFVEYADGEIVNINSRLWTLLIPITRQHQDDIEWLKIENQYLKQKVKILEEKVV